MMGVINAIWFSGHLALAGLGPTRRKPLRYGRGVSVHVNNDQIDRFDVGLGFP